jgi:hypothetical protein
VPTTVPNPNSKVCMMNRIDSDEVILAYNPSSSQRNPLTLASSVDGLNWTPFSTLANNASVSAACLYDAVMVISFEVVQTRLRSRWGCKSTQCTRTQRTTASCLPLAIFCEYDVLRKNHPTQTTHTTPLLTPRPPRQAHR